MAPSMTPVEFPAQTISNALDIDMRSIPPPVPSQNRMI